MDRRDSVVALLAMAMAGSSLPAGTPFRIGLLPDFLAAWRPWLEVISQDLARLGRVEGRDYVFYSSGVTYGKDDPSALARFFESKPDLILVVNLLYAVAVQRAGVQVPVVMLVGGLPVEAGVADSLAHPARNVTGLAIYAGPETWGKLVQLLHEVKPGIKRIGAFLTYVPPMHPAAETDAIIRGLKSGARPLGIDLRVFEIARSDQVDSVLASAASQGIEALVLTSGGQLKKREAMQWAVARQLPTIVDLIGGSWAGVEPAPLLAYGVPLQDIMHQAAPYVNRILWQGAKPGDLPIQLPARLQFVVELKTARAIGLAVPPSMLARADHLVE